MAKSKKVNKWEAAPEGIRNLHNAFTAFNTMSYDELDDKVDWDELDELLVDVLKEYNELEAKHNADCGLISKLEVENKYCKEDIEDLEATVADREAQIDNLHKEIESLKVKNKKLEEKLKSAEGRSEVNFISYSETAADLRTLQEFLQKCGVPVKYKNDATWYWDFENSAWDSAYTKKIADLESKLDRVTRERNNIEYTFDTLIEQLKVKHDIYVNPEANGNGVYEIENKRAADLQEDLDAAIIDLKKEEEYSRSLNNLNVQKNADMCNLKWKRDETEKKIKILTEELISQYNINVTFYQKPGVDMHGLKNFGVHVDCEENRKAFNDLNEELNKYKAKNEKLEEKHAKATRFITRLTEALNEAGVEFHYVKFNGDGEEIFYIDSVVDKCAKRHYEEQSSLLRDTIRNYAEQIRCFKKDIRDLETKIYKLTEDNEGREHRTGSLFLALDRAGIHPIFDNRANKWCIQYTGKAENAFLAADQIKRDAEKKIDKLVSALSKCRLDAKWDHENDKWCIYVQPSDTELTSVSVNLCEVVDGYEKLKEENKLLILEKGHLKSKNRNWQIRYNDAKKKVEELAAVNEGLNDHIEALKKRLNAIYGYRDADNPCGICKNFDPKE